MKASLFLAMAAALGGLWFATAERSPASTASSTVVVELFTSQGCSSCPPADRLLSEIARQPATAGTVIPLAFHVDYWNHIGWRDPFSSARWSARQREYARAIAGSQVYTPQIVVDGVSQLVGNSERHVRAEIARRLEAGDRGTVTIDRAALEGNAVRVSVRARLDPALRRRARIVVALFENGAVTPVTRGENAKRTLTNDCIVRSLSAATTVDGPAEATATVTIPLEPGWRADRLGLAAYLQDPQTLAIYAGAARPVTATAEAGRLHRITPEWRSARR